MSRISIALLAAAALLHLPAHAQQAPPGAPAYDAALAQSLGASEQGMRPYVLVLLKTGSKPVPKGADRDRMFAGHFANMARLAKEKKLVIAGPLDGVDGVRGMFVFATDSLDEARALVATDPVIVQGEMVAAYHKFFSTAALMAVNDIHHRIVKK
ncbi:YciI family protein [Pseudoduganella lutea]|nr:YciI family protein [Pseudoduganella lutea]